MVEVKVIVTPSTPVVYSSMMVSKMLVDVATPRKPEMYMAISWIDEAGMDFQLGII